MNIPWKETEYFYKDSILESIHSEVPGIRRLFFRRNRKNQSGLASGRTASPLAGPGRAAHHRRLAEFRNVGLFFFVWRTFFTLSQPVANSKFHPTQSLSHLLSLTAGL